jgi:hypothetical protein
MHLLCCLFKDTNETFVIYILTVDSNNFKLHCLAVCCVHAAKIKKNDNMRQYNPPKQSVDCHSTI